MLSESRSVDQKIEAVAYQKSLSYARGLSEFGNAFRYVALVLAILRVRNSWHDVAIAETLETTGLILGGFVTPFFIDRVDRIKSLVVADLLALVVSILLIAGAYSQSLALLFFGSFLIMAVSTYYNASLRAATVDLSSGSHASILAGFSFIQLTCMGGALVGSLVAAKFLQHYVSLPLLLAIDALSFLVSSIWIFQILKRLNQLNFFANPARLQSVRPTKFKQYILYKLRQWNEGLQEIALRSTTRMLCLAQFFVGIAYGIYTPIIVSHYKINMGLPDSFAALSQANNRLWALSGAMIRMRKLYSSRTTLIISSLFLSCGYGLAFLFHSKIILGFIGIANLGMALGGPTNNAAISISVSPAYRGRVEALRILMIDIGTLVGNVLVVALGYFLNIKYLFPVAGVMTVVTLGIYAQLRDWPDSQKPAKKD